MNIFLFIEIYSYHILMAIFLRFILVIFPSGITEAFDSVALSIRRNVIKLSERAFQADNNFEVLITSRIILPFIVIFAIENLVLMIPIFIPEMPLTNIVIYILYLFLVMNVFPEREELDDFTTIQPITLFIFIVKSTIFLYFAYTSNNIMYLWALVLPISGLGIYSK